MMWHTEISAFDRAKAVADGNVLHSLGRMVSSRFARNTYGIEISVEYDDRNYEHWARKHLQYKGADGILRIPGAFSVIIEKVIDLDP